MLAREYPYFLKMDVEKFFDTVDHGVLKCLLERKLKDRRLLDLLNRIIDHPMPGGVPDKGLPIGNLTSQHFANYYLGYLDHHVKDTLGVKPYVRYMDDLLLFANEKKTLHRRLASVRTFLRDRLLLSLKDGATIVAPVTQGIPFLGLRVYPGTLRIQRGNWTRCKPVNGLCRTEPVLAEPFQGLVSFFR